MTRAALAWIRKSKGSDDDIGLEQQRADVLEEARDVATDVTELDLGVQTGFSTLTRDEHSRQLLDQRDDVKDTVDDLRDGTYDVLVAYDDRRVARDEYFSVIEHACIAGDCKMLFVSADVERDDLAFDLQRRVERKTKEEEIRKSKKATRERRENGCYHGTVPFGLTYADDDCHLERHPVEWSQLETVFDRRDDGDVLEEIGDDIGVSAATVSRISNRGIEWYEEIIRQYGESDSGPPAPNHG